MDDAEADYIIDAVAFLAEQGERFVPLYHFDLDSGTWAHREWAPEPEPFSLSAALDPHPRPEPMTDAERTRHYQRALDEARAWAERLVAADVKPAMLEGELGSLQYFTVPADSLEEA